MQIYESVRGMKPELKFPLFDCLIQDYMLVQYGLEVEMWRAACFKYGLQEDNDFIQLLTQVCVTISAS